MIVTIFGATGLVGKQLITHCFAKGYTVRAFGRNIEHLIDADLRNENFEVIKGYVFDAEEVRKAIKGSDAVLSVIGGNFNGTDKARSVGLKNIIAQMELEGVKRIVALGGLGVLADANGKYLLEGENYPPEFLAVGLEHKTAYEYLKASTLDWTFICSPNILPLDADGLFETAAEAPVAKMEINAGNLALCMVNELSKNKYLHQRVGIGNV